MTPSSDGLVNALNNVLNELHTLDPDVYASATASWEDDDGRIRTLTLSVGGALTDIETNEGDEQ